VGVATKPLVLLISATAVAAFSFFFHTFGSVRSLAAETVLGYIPLLLGCASLWLCLKAYERAKHKGLVGAYSIMLSPFAFSYPAWILILWILFASGHYNGPMPLRNHVISLATLIKLGDKVAAVQWRQTCGLLPKLS